MIGLLITLPFGTTTILLSGVVRTVWKIWIESTEPATPPISPQSPDLNGRMQQSAHLQRSSIVSLAEQDQPARTSRNHHCNNRCSLNTKATKSCNQNDNKTTSNELNHGWTQQPLGPSSSLKNLATLFATAFTIRLPINRITSRYNVYTVLNKWNSELFVNHCSAFERPSVKRGLNRCRTSAIMWRILYVICYELNCLKPSLTI